MPCNCIEEVANTALEHIIAQCKEKNEKVVLPLKTYDGEGMLNTTFVLGNGGGQYLKTDFVVRTTFKKKDGSESKPKTSHMALIFTYCPFCGVQYKVDELTAKALEEMEPGKIIATGTGIYPAFHKEKEIRWVAVRGKGAPDWALYYHFSENDLQYILDSGDKANGEAIIRKLVPCDDSAWNMYRH